MTSDANRNWSCYDQTSSTVIYSASPSTCKEKEYRSNKNMWLGAALRRVPQHCHGVHQCPWRQGKGPHPPVCPLPCVHLDRWYFPLKTCSSRPSLSSTYYMTSDTNRNWLCYDQTSSTVVLFASPSKSKETDNHSNKNILLGPAFWSVPWQCHGIHGCQGRQGKDPHPPRDPLPCSHLDRWYFPWENFIL